MPLRLNIGPKISRAYCLYFYSSDQKTFADEIFFKKYDFSGNVHSQLLDLGALCSIKGNIIQHFTAPTVTEEFNFLFPRVIGIHFSPIAHLWD